MDYLPLLKIYMQGLYNGLSQVLNTASDIDTITYNGTDYKCRASQREIRLNLESYGWKNIKSLIVYINLDMSTNETITYKGTQYRVMVVDNYIHNINKLQCEEMF